MASASTPASLLRTLVGLSAVSGRRRRSPRLLVAASGLALGRGDGHAEFDSA